MPNVPQGYVAQLRRYQVDALKRFSELGDGDAMLVHMPTGSGKTAVVTAICHFMTEGDALVITHRRALVDQLIEKLNGRQFADLGLDKNMGPRKVIRLLPSTITKELDVERDGPMVFVGTAQALIGIHASKDTGAYDRLRGRLGAVLFDEAHYEPSPTWSAAVRGLGVRGVLLTATPYRNDLRRVVVDPDRICLYSYAQAVQDRFLRKVDWHDNLAGTDPALYATTLVGRIAALEADHRVHPDARIIVRCETSDQVRGLGDALSALGEKVVAIHETFTDTETGVFCRRVPDPHATDARYWIHQYKLIEGIDDHRFQVLALYRSPASGRAVVQQVGRIIRATSGPKAARPLDRAWTTATVLSDPSQPGYSHWYAYKDYDAELAALGPALLTDDGALRSLLDRSRRIAYVLGGFRRPLTVEAIRDALPNVQLPTQANVFDTAGLDLIKLREQMRDPRQQDRLHLPGEHRL